MRPYSERAIGQYIFVDEGVREAEWPRDVFESDGMTNPACGNNMMVSQKVAKQLVQEGT